MKGKVNTGSVISQSRQTNRLVLFDHHSLLITHYSLLITNYESYR